MLNYTIIIVLSIYLIAFIFRPVKFKVLIIRLIIHRLFADIKIDRRPIKSVELLEKEKMDSAIRIFGVGGLLVY